MASVSIGFELNGAPVEVQDDPGSPMTLLDALRGPCGVRSAKDGCAPQGQCGCCTVLVDGKARVSCVTPLRRIAGRAVETVEGLEAEVASTWADAFTSCGGSQCGFCTPGIVMRLEDRRRRGGDVPSAQVERALQAHLCRCTGWSGIVAAADIVLGKAVVGEAVVGEAVVGEAVVEEAAAAVKVASRGTPDAARRRATIESGGPQHIEASVVLGSAGFAADTAPANCLVAMRSADGEWVVGEDVAEVRRRTGKVQGRRTTAAAEPPLAVAPGQWDATLRTSWVEPAYLETDASWCVPGGEPAGVLANGGAFGAKLTSPLPAVARRLADEHGRSVLALWSREDCVRLGPKRPPMAGAMNADGTGVVRVVATPGIVDAIATAAPLVDVEEVAVPGPPTSSSLRGAGWTEAFCLCVAAGAESPLGGRDGAGVRAFSPRGGWARVELVEDAVEVVVGAGEPLDEVVLASHVTGAVHMAAGWVTSEALRVEPDGVVKDLTIRSFGILGPSAMPTVRVSSDPAGVGEPAVAVGSAVFAAAAAAIWLRHGCAVVWPTGTAVL